MAEYMLTEKPDGTIELSMFKYWTNDEDLWLKELRAYRKMYHKEYVDDCLRAESEDKE